MRHVPKIQNRLFRATAEALSVLLILGLAACALPQRPDPQLPGRHWVEKGQPPLAPGLRDRPSLLETGRALGFDDCVFLAMQQSPGLVHSAVALEIAGLHKESAYWKQYPEVHVVMGVTQNLMRKNDTENQESGGTDFWVGFSVNAYNPAAGYFSHEAAAILKKIAILTHQKAIETMAEQIGEILLRLELLTATRQKQALLPELARQAVDYWRAAKSPQDGESLELALARQKQKQAQAILDKTDAEIASMRMNLKLILGLEPEQTLSLESSFPRLFKPESLGFDHAGTPHWEPAWEAGTETRISHLALRLQDYHIMLAWSRYLPEAGFELFSGSSGSTRAGDPSGDDAYAVFKLNVPLLDYGNRSRGVEEARLQKTKTKESLRQHRLAFAQKWTLVDQNLNLLEATLALAEENRALAQLEIKRATIEFESGQSSLTQALERREKATQEAIRVEEARFHLRRQKLSRHFTSGGFVRRFFGTPPGPETNDPAS